MIFYRKKESQSEQQPNIISAFSSSLPAKSRALTISDDATELTLDARPEAKRLRPNIVHSLHAKRRHNASIIKELIIGVLNDFSIEKSKIFVVLRDAAEVMVKVCADLGLKSIDCFAHKLNLSIWDGIRKLNDDETMKNLLERIKKFVRRLKKSRIQREQFENIQELLELTKLTLTKDLEVRWSSTYAMIDRFLVNRQAINLLSAQDSTLPLFSADDWAVISVLRKILAPIHFATNDLQKRGTPLSAVIPLFRVVCFSLEKIGDLQSVKKAIIDGLQHRMNEKIDARGHVKRIAWHEDRELVLATILDPRFKLSFLDAEKHDQYKLWLMIEAENVTNFQDLIGTEMGETDATNELGTQENSEYHDLFSQCQQKIASETGELIFSQPLASPEELNNHQKAEVEVTNTSVPKNLPLTRTLMVTGLVKMLSNGPS